MVYIIDILNGSVYHYRDKDGLECGAVIHLRNGRYGLIEIKLGGDKLIEEGAKSLMSLETKIDIDKMTALSFLMVLTGTCNSYRLLETWCNARKFFEKVRDMELDEGIQMYKKHSLTKLMMRLHKFVLFRICRFVLLQMGLLPLAPDNLMPCILRNF